MAKLLILSLVFPPDNVSTGHIISELAEELKKRGNSIYIITSTPHYNPDEIAEKCQPLKKIFLGLIKKSEYKNIPVYHILMPKKGKNPILRALGWAWFSLAVIFVALLPRVKFEVVFCPSPPLTLGLSAFMISRLMGAQYIYNVQEIYPDFAINSGYLRNKILIKILFLIEKFIYSKSKAISVIGSNMAKNIMSKGISENKIVVIPNFVDTIFFSPRLKENNFRKEHNLKNKFVVSYAGNIGPGQDIESLVRAAYLLKEEKRVHFLLIGAGMLFDEIISDVHNLKLDNITVLKFQPYSSMPEIYSASDLCFVPQEEKIVANAIPSKIYRIMASARPVLATTSEGSDLFNLIKDSNCGIIVPLKCPEKLANAIIWAFYNSDEIERMGMSGRKYVEEHFTKEKITSKYHELIERVSKKI